MTSFRAARWRRALTASQVAASVVLGATRERILLIAIGISVGTPLAIGAGRAVQARLFGISPGSLPVLGSAIAVIAGVGALTIAVPALRAARCNVQQALRHQRVFGSRFFGNNAVVCEKSSSRRP